MDRQEIEQRFDISPHGTIENPGQFEGEQLYAPYFWEMVLDGGCDETVWERDLEISVFHISAKDLEIFPELEGTSQIALWQNEQGFIFVQENPDFDLMGEEDQISVDEYPRIDLAEYGIENFDPDRKDEWTDKRY